ncbi:hypothetical protein BDB01DRAFT_776677 [Pilobolus umbonatus]|nr:hypothetical protein BDB01DRAFT_776677 [Pilobolus umbonatus]
MKSAFYWLLLLLTQYSLQQEIGELPGALSTVPLNNGMFVIAYLVQYSNHLTYTLYLNANGFPYYDNGVCLSWVIGTPYLMLDSTNECSFLDDEYQMNIPINPCQTPILTPESTEQLTTIEMLSGAIPLGTHRFNASSLIPIVNIDSTNSQIYPNALNTVAGKSILISYTNYRNGTQELEQYIRCSNIKLGNGTLTDYVYYPNVNGTFRMPNNGNYLLPCVGIYIVCVIALIWNMIG